MKILWVDLNRFGIRARLLTLLLPAILGLLGLDSWNDYRALHNQVQDAYDQAMLESVHVLRGSLSVSQDGLLRLNAPLAVQAVIDTASPVQKYLHIGLTGLTPQGVPAGHELTLLGKPDLPAPPPRPGAAALSETPVTVWYDSYYRNHPVRVVALQSKVSDGLGQAFALRIQVAESTEPRDNAQAATLRQELIRDTRMVLVVIVLVWLGVTWSLRPLERLRKTVLQTRDRDLKPLDAVGVPHEVAPLVDAVNQHLASYRDLLEQQSQFLADASHQLRTPLAIMLTQAGVALREKDPEQLHTTLRAMVVQISRSRRLCEQLLSLAHANERAMPEGAPAVVDLNSVAKDVVLQHLTLAREKNQDLGWVDAREVSTALAGLPPEGPAVPVLAQGAELHEALSNLVHNAIVYTPVGGHITVMVSIQGSTALVEVRDDGPGIDPARRTEVFERFHSAALSGKKGLHGAGLGLAIARAYARRNGGDIELAGPASGAGLRAIVRLPLASGQAG